jgi:hypothetical protein
MLSWRHPVFHAPVRARLVIDVRSLDGSGQSHRSAGSQTRGSNPPGHERVEPNAGSYVSESNFFEPDWQKALWGENYARLLAVKEKYDPAGLFFVHHGVGSEAWSADGFTKR